MEINYREELIVELQIKLPPGAVILYLKETEP
jgi:hypothetical protein